MAHRIVGNTLVEWEPDDPFAVTLRGETGAADNRRLDTFKIDLRPLRIGYTDEFLLHLKDHLIERCNHVRLPTIPQELKNLSKCFRQVLELGLFESKIGIIDETFLLCLSATKDRMSGYHLRYLKQTFNSNPYSPIFANGLHQDDFPTHKPLKGHYGEQIDRILQKALSRAAVAHILDRCDTAFAKAEIDIGHYSFAHLAFAVFVRPESYRQILVSDLKSDATTKQYFIDIVTAKSKSFIPAKVRYGLNETLGLLLTKQRQNVISRYGHLVEKKDINKLALFPARQQRKDQSWVHEYANQHFGMYQTASQFAYAYSHAIEKQLGKNQITLAANSLRHTVGTLLAQTGASAKTIQSVLKHATDTTCKAYVDIAFKGLMYELSEAMQPAFAEHLPSFLSFRSKLKCIAPEKRIYSENYEARQSEEVGGCSKDIVCENAPIVCYSCFRFNPCWDADHSIILRIVEREIEEMSKLGKPFQHMVEKARIAKNHIIVVMNAVDRYREAVSEGAQV